MNEQKISYDEWVEQHQKAIDDAIEAKNYKEAERIMQENDGFDNIDWDL